MSLTLLVQAPDVDALRQLIDDLPSLAAVAAELPGCSVVLVDGDHVLDITREGG